MHYASAIVLLALISASFSAVPLPYVSETDRLAYADAFKSALTSGSDDLASVHHALNGLKLLGIKLDDAQAKKVCAQVQSAVDQSDVASVYHASGAAANLASCQLNAPKANEVLAGVLVMEAPPVQEVYFAAAATKQLGLKLDQTGLFSALTSALKKDDTPSGLGYALHAAVYLEQADHAGQIFSRVEDLVGQADEVDNGKYMQFDGGISVTAIAVSGIYSLADKLNKAPIIKAEQTVKLANYLLSRRGVRLVRPAAHLLKALTLLTTNKFHIPLSLSLTSSVAVSSAEPSIAVKACNVLGGSVGAGVSVSIDAAEHVPSRATVISKQAMQPVQSDASLFKFALFDGKRERGFYSLKVSASSGTDKRLVGASGVELAAKIVTSVSVEDVELQALDRDQTSTSKAVHKPKVFTKVGSVIEADYHQKMNMKFVVREKSSGQAIRVHQAFVVFTHVKTKQEIVFVAEPEANTNVYKFEIAFQKAAKDFDSLSGRYSMRLVVGDAVVANPVDWLVADLELKFLQPEGESAPAEPMAAYKAKPVIQHTFRQPEKRPPGLVSDVFTLLCLSPILIMLALWVKIGINFGNMPVSLFTLGFHVGLAGILGLYFMFFLRLNMFTTLKCLAGIGGLTFLCANRMLRNMADYRKSKSE